MEDAMKWFLMVGVVLQLFVVACDKPNRKTTAPNPTPSQAESPSPVSLTDVKSPPVEHPAKGDSEVGATHRIEAETITGPKKIHIRSGAPEQFGGYSFGVRRIGNAKRRADDGSRERLCRAFVTVTREGKSVELSLSRRSSKEPIFKQALGLEVAIEGCDKAVATISIKPATGSP
jgi:hypothetical protein